MNYPRELLKGAFIEAMEGRTKIHDLNPNAVRVAKFLGDATGLSQLGIHLMTVMPGHEVSEYHRHLYEEECYYVLSGSGEAVIDETSYAIEAGDFLGFPANGVANTIVNTSAAPLVLFAVRQMLDQDVCDYPRKSKRLYMNGTEEAFVDMIDIRR